jgi:type IV secretory pathway TrbL component
MLVSCYLLVGTLYVLILKSEAFISVPAWMMLFSCFASASIEQKKPTLATHLLCLLVLFAWLLIIALDVIFFVLGVGEKFLARTPEGG